MEIKMPLNAFTIMLDYVKIDISVDINTLMKFAQKVFVETQNYKFRHHKTCKFGDECKFLKLKCCFYNHKHSNNEKFNKLSKEVDELKAEIINLKYDTKFKEDQLKALAQNEAEKSKTVQEIRKQNDLLKRDIQSLTETNSNLNETIANQQIKYLDIIIKYIRIC